jgi:hypothetical protein
MLRTSDRFNQIVKKNAVKVNVVLEIDGIINISNTGSNEYFRLDTGLFLDDGIFLDAFETTATSNSSSNEAAVISINGSTTNVGQKIGIDKGYTGASSFNLRIIDYNDTYSEMFTGGNTVDEILGSQARVYLTLEGLNHPQDSLLLINGFINNIIFNNNGTIDLRVSHTLGLIRKTDFFSGNSKLKLNENETSTTLNLVDDKNYIDSEVANTLELYALINNEIIRYTGLVAETDSQYPALSGVTRAQLDTVQTSHDKDSSVETRYKLIGNPLELALQLLVGSSKYTNKLPVIASNQVTTATNINGALKVNNFDAQFTYGLSVGDNILGTINGVGIDVTITGFGKNNDGTSYVLTDGNFATNATLTDSLGVKSKYDVFNGSPDVGAKVPANKVDVVEIQNILKQFPIWPTLEIYLHSEIDYIEFIQKELLRPFGMYLIPTEKISIKYSQPPLSVKDAYVLNENNIINPQKIKSTRSTGNYFYNTIIYKFEETPEEEGKFLAGEVNIDADSSTLIPVGTKSYVVSSKGIREKDRMHARYASRYLLNRYSRGSEVFNVECNFETIKVEIGDVVRLQGCKIYNSNTGKKNDLDRYVEVIDKKINFTKGSVNFVLLDSGLDNLKGRTGVVCPASKITTIGTNYIVVQTSFGYNGTEVEKYNDFLGITYKIYNDDHSLSEELTIDYVDTATNRIYFNSNIVESYNTTTHDVFFTIADYNTSAGTSDDLAKSEFGYIGKVITLTSGTGFNTTIDVGASDIDLFYKDDKITVIKSDFSKYEDAIISSVNTNTNVVTLSKALTFSPASGDFVTRTSFDDASEPYIIT